MKLLYSLLDFTQICGSQMYFYELASKMVAKGHDCTLISNIGGEITAAACEKGVKCLPYSELGRLNEQKFDLIHASHKPILEAIIENNVLPAVPVVQTCHSEIIPLELPFLNERVKHYIAIRPTVVDKILESGVKLEQISLIYNPIDETLFNKEKTEFDGYVLFVGSIDKLRKNALLDTINNAGATRVIVVGRNDYPELLSKYPNVSFIEPTLGVSKYFKGCDYVEGIQGGRTKYEALFCGKQYFDHQVNANGDVVKTNSCLELESPEIHTSTFVVNEIEKLYLDTIKKVLT